MVVRLYESLPLTHTRTPTLYAMDMPALRTRWLRAAADMLLSANSS